MPKLFSNSKLEPIVSALRRQAALLPMGRVSYGNMQACTT
jgi:hypothetical protein